MKAVIYARYSSSNQREESIEGQLRECKEFANRHDFVVVGEYIDRALSGKTDNRPSFQKLIKDSERHQFDVVILYTLDRFARNRYDSAVYKARLKKNGVKVFYAKQEISDSPEGIILESVLEGMAEYYSENLARSIRRGMKDNALKGIGMGHQCLGYRIGKDRMLEIDPVQAKAVQFIFERYAAGDSKKTIVDLLNKSGYKTSRGQEFNNNSLGRILKNDKYIGVYRFADVVIENAVPSIISKQLFDKVQATLKHNYSARAKSKATEDYLLTTKLFCGHCGAAMVGESGTSKTGAIHRYYKCNCKKKTHSCDKKAERKKWMEDVVVEHAVKEMLTAENIELISGKAMEIIEKEAKDTSMLDSLQASLKDTTKRMDNVLKAIEEGVITSTTKERLESLEIEKREIEKKIAREEIKKPFLTKEHISFWLNSFKKGNKDDVEYKRRIIDSLVNSVFAYDDDGGKRIVITFNLSGSETRTLKSSDIEHIGTPYAINPNTLFFVKHCFGFILFFHE